MPMRVEIVPAARFARASAEALLELAGRYPEPVIGLPTGRTPVGMYEELARMVAGAGADVRSWRPFAIDEYVGPRAHACSNRAFFGRYWEGLRVARPVEQFDPEATDLAAEAEAFARRLSDAGGLQVAVLGIGVNGHLAFNEPGSTGESTARVVELHAASRASAASCWGSETPTHGLTLGLRELLASPAVLLLADGPAKARIVALALHGAASPECPASFLQEHPDVTVVLDEAAAAG